MLKPAYNYLLLKKIEPDTGVVTDSDVEDTHQYYEIVGVPEKQGHYEYGTFVPGNYRAGQKVYVEKHSEANTPKELNQQGLALVLVSRVIAVESEK